MNVCIWILLLTAFCPLPSAFCIPTHTSQEEGKKSSKSPAPLDINRATAEDFTTLPGIGPELARRIVAYREKHGPFKRVEDLLVIKGMGRKKWRAIRPYLRIGNEAGSAAPAAQPGD